MTTLGRPPLCFIHGWGPGGSETKIKMIESACQDLGFKTRRARYGRVWTPWGTKFLSRQKAKNWSHRFRPGEVLIGRSNGARVVWETTYYTGSKVRVVFFLNPALDPYCVPGPAVKKCFVFHNPRDRAVQLASLLPFSDWGQQGRIGYQPDDSGLGADPRMENVDIGGIGHGPKNEAEAKRYAIMIAACLHRL